MPNIRGPELLVLVLVIVILFGAKRLPDAARSVGRSLRIFKAETKGLTDSEQPDAGDVPATSGTAAPGPQAVDDGSTQADPGRAVGGVSPGEHTSSDVGGSLPAAPQGQQQPPQQA